VAANVLLGCIADDFTGATDLANTLVRSGMRVIQTIGVPQRPPAANIDAVVVALKSRTIEPDQAIAQSLQALRWLSAAGAQQIVFKICSTFDSTPRGNIGPVTEALMDALGCDFAIATPAFPDNGRTVFRGHLFVGDQLLSDSSMRNHPLTPMTDSNLVRVLQAQCQRRVGLIDYQCVARGVDSIRARMDALRAEGFGLAVLDAVSNDDLMRAGLALRGAPLVTSGSGLAIGLPANFGIAASEQAAALPRASGAAAIVSGSCSVATQKQVAHFQRSGGRAFAIDPIVIATEGDSVLTQLIDRSVAALSSGPVLIYSTATADQVAATQARLGASAAGAMLEQALARIAAALVASGVGRLIVAGGETSGACVQALEVQALRIGAQIDVGVPWCHADQVAGRSQGLHLCLKSGNFGGEDFFSRALAVLDAQPFNEPRH
jgi:uncharacterized protein YgbK (DUF1537 family)